MVAYQLEREMLKMEKFLSFVDAYVAHILTVIFGIAAVYFYNPKGSSEETSRKKWNSIVKIGATLLGVAVIVMCYINYTSNAEKPGDGENATASTTIGKEQSVAVNSDLAVELAESAYAIIEASSTYDGDRATHIAYNLIDNNLKTNWTEGVQGNGEGQYVDFVFHTEQPIAGFIISSGNHASDTYYAKNSRPKTITLTFSDGSTREYALWDKKETKKIYFDNIINTTSIRLTIDSVYSGSAYEDTVISEIAFLVQESP